MSEEILNEQQAPQEAAPEVAQEAVQEQAPAQEQVQAEDLTPPVQDLSLQELIGEDLYNSSNIKDFKSVEDLAKSYDALSRWKGTAIKIPGPDASPEAREDFYAKLEQVPDLVRIGENKENLYAKLGKPESAEAYELEIPDELAAVATPDNIAMIKQKAFEMNLSQDQVNAWVQNQADIERQAIDRIYVSPEDAQAQLQKLWGNDYENRLEGAKLAAKYCQENHPDSFNNIINGPLANDPMLMDLLSRAAKGMAESGAALGTQQVNYGVSPEDAKLKIKEKFADRGFMSAYENAMDPGHKQAVETMTQLYKQANPQ